MSDVAVATVPIMAGALLGAWCLRRAWLARGDDGGGWRLAGWGAILFSFLWPSWVLGSVRGLFVSITLISVAALIIVASGANIRTAKQGGKPSRPPRDGLAPEPLERPGSLWRSTLRWLLAGPIGMIAAMAVAICYAVWVPGEPQTRLLIGGLIVPFLWGGAMAWTLADNRIIRATAVLVGTTIVGFGLAILKGFA